MAKRGGKMKRPIMIEEKELNYLEHYSLGMNRIREKLQVIYNSTDMTDNQHNKALRACSQLAGQLSQAIKNFVEKGEISEVNIDI